MRSFSAFFLHPSPRGRGADIADNCLTAFSHMDNRHLLLALRSIFLEGRDLRRERPGKFVEGPLGAVLLLERQ